MMMNSIIIFIVLALCVAQCSSCTCGLLTMSCSTNTDCGGNAECNNNMCRCGVATLYSELNGDCSSNCTQPSGTFVAYPNYGILDNNDEIQVGKTIDECIEFCLQETKYVCMSIEFVEATGKCLFSKATWTTTAKASDRNYPDPGYNLYLRQCM